MKTNITKEEALAKLATYIHQNCPCRESIAVPTNLIYKIVGGKICSNTLADIRRMVTFLPPVNNNIIIPKKENPHNMKSATRFFVINKDKFDVGFLREDSFVAMHNSLIKGIIAKAKEAHPNMNTEYLLKLLAVADILYRGGRDKQYVNVNKRSTLCRIADCIKVDMKQA